MGKKVTGVEMVEVQLKALGCKTELSQEAKVEQWATITLRVKVTPTQMGELAALQAAGDLAVVLGPQQEGLL